MYLTLIKSKMIMMNNGGFRICKSGRGKGSFAPTVRHVTKPVAAGHKAQNGRLRRAAI